MTEDERTPAAISVHELAVILFRRRWWLVAPMVAGVAAALAYIMLVPAMYRSSATLLITSQQIPTTVVAAPLTNYADERIAKIRQQILSRANLTALIEAKQLYPAERARLPLDMVLNIMRDAVAVDLVGTNGSRAAQAGNTIAFTLSFTYRDPRLAHDVTERLTTMFLAEDRRLRTEQATGTAAFLGRRAAELRAQLVDLAAKRREIEARYAGALPDQVAVSAQAGAALRAELSRTDSETQGLQEQSSLLALRGQEIGAAPSAGAAAVHAAEEKLAQLSAVYSDDYPEVVAARRALERQRAAARATAAPSGSALVTTEIAASRARIGALAARRAQLVQQLSDIERSSARAPQAAYELSNLDRDFESVRLQYQGIREKQMDAQVAANLQTENKGERFSVVDPPSLPFVPIGLGKTRALLLGLIAGAGMGLAGVLAWELLAGPVHGERGVVQHLGAPPLVAVPLLKHGGYRPLRELLRRLLSGPGMFRSAEARL